MLNVRHSVGQINLYIFACVLSCKFLSTFMCRESLRTFWPWGGFRIGSKPDMVPILLGKFSSSNLVGEPDQVKTRTTIYSAWNVADSLGWVDLPRRLQKLSETMNLVKTTISHIKEARIRGDPWSKDLVGTMQGGRLQISICPCWAGDHTTRCWRHQHHLHACFCDKI